MTLRASRLRLSVLCCCMVLAGCSSGESGNNLSGTKGKSIEVTEASWHAGTWPFTVEGGILGCTKPPYPGEVTFNTEGTVYGLNGTALDQRLPEVDPIWLHEGSELRVDIGPMIERGLKLCEEASSEWRMEQDQAGHMSYAQPMADSSPRLDRTHTVTKGQLVATTPEVNREVAGSAMLLSQGARRAIEMMCEATEADDHAEPTG